MLTAAGLVLEDSPLTSVYLGGRLGRRVCETKNNYPTQVSSILVAHKTADFVCRSGDMIARLESPRQPDLEAIGVVISAWHPDMGTFLAPAVADHLIKR